jgi:hypothetical protein
MPQPRYTSRSGPSRNHGHAILGPDLRKLIIENVELPLALYQGRPFGECPVCHNMVHVKRADWNVPDQSITRHKTWVAGLHTPEGRKTSGPLRTPSCMGTDRRLEDQISVMFFNARGKHERLEMMDTDGKRYGIQFRDGSIRDSWNGAGQRARAFDELLRLVGTRANPYMQLVYRLPCSSEWFTAQLTASESQRWMDQVSPPAS